MKKRFLGILSISIWLNALFFGNIVQAAGSSIPLTTSDVTITNNVIGKPDTMFVTGVTNGDVITVYSSAGKALTTKKVTGTQTSATLSVAQLGVNAGTIYMTVTSTGLSESSWTGIYFPAEGVSEDPLADNITITNNSGKADTIYVCGLAPGDKINVYTAATEGKFLGSATVGTNKTDVIKAMSQLGVSSGSLYISVTTKGMRESNRVEAVFSGENQSNKINSNNVKITNNSGKSDTIYISGLVPKDKIQIYNQASGGNLLTSATVGSDKTDVTMSLSQLTTDSGDIYISNTSSGMLESTRTRVSYSDEDESSSVPGENVTITNNSGTSDIIYVTGISSGDTVNVYNDSTNGKLLGSAKASSNGDATVTIGQLGTGSGTVYISVETSGMHESSRKAVSYSSELKSSIISADNIITTNNSGKSDTVYVSGLSESQIVNVYNAVTGGSKLGSATVASNSSEATINISQLGTSAGSIYVSITDKNSVESDRVKVDYSAEGASESVSIDDVAITNNPSGTADTVYVSELNPGDLIKVYKSISDSTILGSTTVGDSSTDATISITQLGAAAGSVYISRTESGKSQSSRVKVDYSSESKSKTLDASNIVVTNNVGSDDTIQVSGVSSNQVIKVYDAAKSGNLLGTAKVASGSTDVTVTVSQLASEAGSVYVSLTDTNKVESDRVQATYTSEATSEALSASNIEITNRSGSADTVSIIGASQNDIIKVYDSAKGGTLLGSAKVSAGETKASISMTQIGTDVGSVYVSRTSSNKGESGRIKVDYDAEPKSTDPSASNIIVTNNAGINDTVQVKGLSASDLVQIYDSASGGTLLGSATVASNATEVTASIAQLGTGTGNIYVSITNTNKSESNRIQASFTQEAQSIAPDSGKISIVNNAGKAGTVKVQGLTNGDLVKIYDSANAGTVIGTGTVGTYDTSITVSVTQLGENAGDLYVTITSKGKLESSRTRVSYEPKTASIAPSTASITVTNNSSIGDTVELIGLQPNDVINVYDASTGENLLGTITVGSSAMEGTVTISQLGTSAGTIYVSVTSTGKTESSRTEVQYSAEAQSDYLDSADVTIENNAGVADTIEVTGVSEGDIIKVYNVATNGTALGTATVASGYSQATINISQLGTNAGTIYVSVTRSGKTESSRTAVTYSAESIAPVVGNIYVVNNAVIADTITVKGLTSNDIAKIYDASTGGNLIGSASVGANSEEAKVTVSQLTTGAGSVYISVTEFGKGESKRTKADYIAEQTSASLYSGNVQIINNTLGTSDNIVVSNLSSSDVIKVYDASIGGNLIGTATVSYNGTQVTITIPQLSSAAGNVYISVTNIGKNESSRTGIGYIAEK